MLPPSASSLHPMTRHPLTGSFVNRRVPPAAKSPRARCGTSIMTPQKRVRPLDDLTEWQRPACLLKARSRAARAGETRCAYHPPVDDPLCSLSGFVALHPVRRNQAMGRIARTLLRDELAGADTGTQATAAGSTRSRPPLRPVATTRAIRARPDARRLTPARPRPRPAPRASSLTPFARPSGRCLCPGA